MLKQQLLTNTGLKNSENADLLRNLLLYLQRHPEILDLSGGLVRVADIDL